MNRQCMAGQAAIYGLRKMNSELKIIGTSGPNPTGDISLSAQPENEFFLKPYSADKLLKAVRAKLDEI